MSLEPMEDWTQARRRTLAAVSEHLVPPLHVEDRHEVRLAVANYVVAALSEPRFAAQAPLVWAALDELDARCGDGRSFADIAPEKREFLLRELEAESNPYLSHAVVILLQLSLEGFLCDPARGGNPRGVNWSRLGLPKEGQAWCLPPVEPGDEAGSAP